MGQFIRLHSTKIILSIAGLWIIVYTMWVFLGWRNAVVDASLATFTLAFTESLAVVYGFRVSRISSLDKRLRHVWRWISRALMVSAIAEWLWFIYMTFHLQPLPWLTDILYLLYNVFILIALFRFPFASARRSERTIF